MINITPDILAILMRIYEEHRVKFPNVTEADELAVMHGEQKELIEANRAYFLCGTHTEKLAEDIRIEEADVLIACIRLIGEWGNEEAMAVFEKHFNYVSLSYVLSKWEIVKQREYIGNHHIEE